MRLNWLERALNELEGIAERAPKSAGDIHAAVIRLLESPFPGMHRRVRGKSNEHILSISPHVVFYRVDGDTLTVLRVRDGRRITEPW